MDLSQQTRSFYTYSSASEPADRRWRHTGVPGVFFETFDAARDAVLAIRKEVSGDPAEGWSPQRVEKIELRPLIATTIIALLSGNIAEAVERYEIVSTIE